MASPHIENPYVAASPRRECIGDGLPNTENHYVMDSSHREPLCNGLSKIFQISTIPKISKKIKISKISKISWISEIPGLPQIFLICPEFIFYFLFAICYVRAHFSDVPLFPDIIFLFEFPGSRDFFRMPSFSFSGYHPFQNFPVPPIFFGFAH